MKKLKKILMLCCILTVVMSNLNVLSAKKNIVAGEGVGVSSHPPSTGGTISIMGTKPPSTSNQTITLGTYNGSITWATATLYSDKWVKTSGTTIKIEAYFGQYGTKQDAIDRKNALIQLQAGIPVRLVSKSGQKTSWQYIYCNKTTQTLSFTVTANTDYYVECNFNTGFYHSGDFTVFK